MRPSPKPKCLMRFKEFTKTFLYIEKKSVFLPKVLNMERIDRKLYTDRILSLLGKPLLNDNGIRVLKAKSFL